MIFRRLLSAAGSAESAHESGGSQMAPVAFLLAVLLGCAAFLFREAAAEISVGTAWAHSVCSALPVFCHNPEYLAYAAGALLVLGISAKIANMAN
jgi:hypothetical protein